MREVLYPGSQLPLIIVSVTEAIWSIYYATCFLFGIHNFDYMASKNNILKILLC